MRFIILISIILEVCEAKNIVIKNDNSIILQDTRSISLKQLVLSVEDYQIIFFADHHDTIKTHEFFKSFLDTLILKGYTIHLANEWFTPRHNNILKLYTDDKISSIELKNRRSWYEEISTKWKLSEMLYETVKKSNGRLYGINMPKEMRKKISLKLFDDMNIKEKNFYYDLDLNISEHKFFVMPLFDNCCKNKSKKEMNACKRRMYRVQVA